MKVKYVGPAKDYSGYGECSRHDINSLLAANIKVTADIPIYTMDQADYGKVGALAVECENLPLGYRVKILHTTPNVYTTYFEADKYHIGRAFWETDKVPLAFATNLQLVNEIWTGSETNKKAIENAGITKPVVIIPEAIDTEIEVHNIKPFLVEQPDAYKFYSIFEWTERKNPKGLLEAYWRAFEDNPKAKVMLMLKTYVDNFNPEKYKEIDQAIKKLKAQLNLTHYAPVYMYRELMTRHQIYRFHKTGDCFISAHRGEGWGIPQMEAMLIGNPIISTNYGGIHDYLKDGVNAMLIPYTMTPVSNTRNKQWYTTDQKWADADLKQMAIAIRTAYDNKDKMAKIGKAGQKLVKEKFSFKAVGALMRKRLYEITHELLQDTKS